MEKHAALFIYERVPGMTTSNSLPVLETRRTILRPHSIDDLDDCIALWSDPEVTRFISSKPFSRSETWARLLRYIGHWQVMGFSLWAVECRETGAFLGEAGFFEHRRDVVPAYEGMPEAGWVLKPSAHGKGLATEIMQAALYWADENIESTGTICLLDPWHKKSIRVAGKLGYENPSSVIFNGNPAITMVRLRTK